ncbi:MAG TPA: ribonuclease R [Bacteroidales bacterium]|nr:ribonuclease R [Bacteroidales bacterium]
MKKKKLNLGNEIIKVLSEGGNLKYNYKQIAAKIGIFDKNGREKVKRIIEDFVSAKIILIAGRGKYRLNPKHYRSDVTGRNYITGQLTVRASGSAFVISENGDGDDIFISEGNLQNALHGDTVKVLLFPTRKEKRREGEVVEIVKRNEKFLTGVVKQHNGTCYFIPDSPSYKRDILIPARFVNGAKNGEKVVVSIVDWTPDSRSPIGKVENVLGKPGEHNVEMNAILVENDFPLRFSPEVENEVAKFEDYLSESEISKRRDFRTVPTFTIDPVDAKDFDDAISYEKLESGLHRVGIHIADVSFYVKKNSLVDKEAYERGTSVYLVDRVVPMLPEKLSNFLCSLRPNEDKLCYSAVFDLDDNAHVRREWFGRTVIHSNRQFSYDEVQEIIENKSSEMSEVILPVYQLTQKLRKSRLENFAINFESAEVKFVLDENGKPVDIFLYESKESNFLIEELMLLANKKVAEKIGKKDARQKEIKTFVYRIHDEPISDKLEKFKTFAHKLGYDLKTGSRKALVSSFNKMLEESKKNHEHDMINQLTIRLMARAVYSTENIGHYGLAFPYYTHFTSPIRRYPDLMVHRLLDGYLKGKPSVNKDEYETYCKHASQMEQKATEAERSSIKFKQAEYLSERVGQEFEAIVTGIAKWGVYAEIKESKCEGLIPIRKFDDDFYYIDEDNYALIGLHKGRNLQMGSSVIIKVEGVDVLKKQINFDIVRIK